LPFGISTRLGLIVSRVVRCATGAAQEEKVYSPRTHKLVNYGGPNVDFILLCLEKAGGHALHFHGQI